MKTTINGEIVVADSSGDQTGTIAKSLGARVIRPEKSGYGNAYLAGFKHARGRYIVMGDADNTYDFLEIPILLAPLKNGADFVIGSRFKGTIHKGSMDGLHRYSETRFSHGCLILFSVPIILIPTADFVRSPAKPLTGCPFPQGVWNSLQKCLSWPQKNDFT